MEATEATEVQTQETGGAEPQENQELTKRTEDMFRYKREAKAAMDEKVKLESELEKLKTEQMKKSNQYKELYEQATQKTQEYESKYSQLQNALVETKKMDAIERAAISKGIDKSYLDFLTSNVSESVIVESTSTGRVNVIGADEFVDSFKEKFPKLFDSGNPPKVNNATGEYQASESGYTPAQLLEIQKKDPAKYREIFQKKQHLIRRS